MTVLAAAGATGTALAALPTAARLAALRRSAPSANELVALGDEAERLATVDLAAADRLTETLVALADEGAPARVRARARRARAQALAYGGHFAAALRLCEEAVAIASAGDEAVEAARGRLASMHPLTSLARHEDAIAAGEAARCAFLAAGERSLAARADFNLGAAHDARDDPARALRHYDRARADLAAEPATLAQLDANRGVALMNLDDLAGAERAFRDAVATFHGAGDRWAAAIAEGNLAFLATRQGHLDRALYYFEQARRSLEAEAATVELARLGAEQADAMAQLGGLAEAVAAFERALPALDQHGLAVEATTARAGFGRALLRLGRLGEAEIVLGEAAAAFDALALPISRARVDLVRAELAIAAGRSDEASQLLTDALEGLGERPVEAVAGHVQRARLALSAGDTAEAEEALAAAVPIAEAVGLTPVLADLLHLRGSAARARGATEAALEDMRTAVGLVERVRGNLQAERLRTAFLGNRQAIHEAFVVQALARGDESAVAEAFATVERAKSRSLLDVVGGALDLTEAAEASDDPGEAALLGELARLRAELSWLYGRVGDEPAHDASERQGEIAARESRLDAVRDRLAVGRGIGGLFAPAIDLAGAARLVPAEAALVEYFVADGSLLAFVVRPGQTAVFPALTSIPRLTEQVRRVHFQIGRAAVGEALARTGPRLDRLLADARRELATLYDLVLAPLMPGLAGAARLVVVPHGPLHAVPFHALWDGERYVIEGFEVQTVPSASLLERLGEGRPEAVRSGDEALVVGVPDGLAPKIGREAAQLAARLGATALLGAEATVERVTRAARGADVIHLACHGRFSVENPLASGLKLADRWLTVRDIYALRLRAELVTLSACDTGRAVVGTGDELAGLVRGFYAAGAASLLLSLWLVNDECAAHQMGLFYDAWRGGAAKPAALRLAQRAMLAERPHPAFWAPFVLGGNP